jgi:hypothetical protein
MAPRSSAAVLEPTPTADAPGAYPLTMLTYAAIKPLSLDAAGRAEYAAFIDYAVTAGQTPGFDFGELPIGYTPLPPAMREQALAATKVIRDPASLVPVAPNTTSTTIATASAPGTNSSSSSGAGAGSNATPPATGRPNSGTSSRPSSGASTVTVAPPTDTSIAEVAPVTSQPVDAEVAPVTTVLGDVTPATTAPPPVTAPLDLPASRFLVVGLGVLALLSALFALEITKRTRRATAADAPVDAPAGAEPIELELTEQPVNA